MDVENQIGMIAIGVGHRRRRYATGDQLGAHGAIKHHRAASA